MNKTGKIYSSVSLYTFISEILFFQALDQMERCIAVCDKLIEQAFFYGLTDTSRLMSATGNDQSVWCFQNIFKRCADQFAVQIDICRVSLLI